LTKLRIIDAKTMENLLFSLGFEKVRQKGSHIFPREYLERELNIDDPDDREIKINNLGNITFYS